MNYSFKINTTHDRSIQIKNVVKPGVYELCGFRRYLLVRKIDGVPYRCFLEDLLMPTSWVSCDNDGSLVKFVSDTITLNVG